MDLGTIVDFIDRPARGPKPSKCCHICQRRSAPRDPPQPATAERPCRPRWRAFGRCRSLADQRIAPETGRPRATRQGALQPWHWRRSQKTALWRPACASSFSARARHRATPCPCTEAPRGSWGQLAPRSAAGIHGWGHPGPPTDVAVTAGATLQIAGRGGQPRVLSRAPPLGLAPTAPEGPRGAVFGPRAARAPHRRRLS